MSLFKFLARILGFGFVIGIFQSVVIFSGISAFGKMGGWGGLALSNIVLLGVALTSEKIIARIHKADQKISDGLTRSLRLVLGQNSVKRLPRILTYCDPNPNLFIARSLFGRGTLFISQGLICTAPEEDLRKILKRSVERSTQWSTFFQSYCAIWIIGILSLAPRHWVDLVYTNERLALRDEHLLSPLSSFGFLIFLPVIQACLFMIDLDIENKRGSLRTYLPTCLY